MSQPAYMEKMTSVQRKSCFQRKCVTETLTDPSSHKSDYDNQDHKDFLGSNESPTRLSETSTSEINTVCYIKNNLQQIIQLIF